MANPIVIFESLIVVVLATMIKSGCCISDGSGFSRSTEAKPHSLPWQIVLLKKDYAVCSGALLNNMWAVTTAHCISNIDTSEMTVVMGEHNLYESEGTEETAEPDKIYMHPKFNKTTTDNDIALIKFKTPIKISKAVRPIALPTYEDVSPRSFCVVSGWGKTSLTASDRPDTLRQAIIPITSNAECNGPLGYKGEITKRMLCAGYKYGGPDACTGDSGGPLSCPTNRHRDRERSTWVLGGLVSWGSECGVPFKYGVYTRISCFKKWIENLINN